ncbi:uncharacterized protein LOC134813132 [Bolinopsis microptera]|uniref:uncharacterized protein LOC134813132 n=1 Tax=Bolinopsis microptera TaxID=2820187 RepID=UPI003079696A
MSYHKVAGNLPNSELEVSRVLALNEVFTANTNLSIKVNDDILQAIFDKLLTLVNAKSLEELALNSRATYRYLEMLENILDLEESNQVLYKLQANVLRFIRNHWVELNGSMITDNGTSISLDLLNCRYSTYFQSGSDCRIDLEVNNWKGLYFVKMLSLMATCASGSLKSSLTICKELIPYQDLKILIEKCSTDVVYLKCLLKFFLNVYVKSNGQLKKVALVSDVLQYTATGSKLIEVLYNTLLEPKGDVPTQLNNLSSMRYFEISLKLLNEDDTTFIDLLDFVFNSALPLVAEVFTAPMVLLNENGGPEIAKQLSVNMRLLLKATSPFLNEENFNMLLSAIKAVNSYKPERGNDLEVKFEGETWRVNACGTAGAIKPEEAVVAQNEDSHLKSTISYLFFKLMI